MSFSEFEKMKMALLYQKEYSIDAKGKALVIGGERDKDEIDSAVTKFGKQVTSVVEKFIKKTSGGHVDTVVLTGGGTMIPGVNAILRQALEGSGSQIVNL